MKSAITLSLIVLMACSTAVFAVGVKPSNGLSLSVGPGIGVQEKYSGSNEVSTVFIPYIDAEYVSGSSSVFLSVSDGLGAKYRFMYPGIFAAGGVYLGNSREPGDAGILEGTAKVTNNVSWFVKTGYESGFFDVFVSARYFPISMEYRSNLPDEKRNGLLYTAACAGAYPVFNNLLLTAELGCSAMNADYAKAYYGNRASTRYVGGYRPGGGLNRVYFEPTAVFFTGYDVSINIQGHVERLLGDAAGSPLVKSKTMVTGLVYVSYDI